VLPLLEELRFIVPPCKLATANPLMPTAFIIGFPQIDPGLQWPLYGRQPTIHPTKILYKEFNELRMLCQGSDFLEEPNGMSGGAVVDFEGKVVGIINKAFKKLTPENHIFCATPIDFVRANLFPKP